MAYTNCPNCYEVFQNEAPIYCTKCGFKLDGSEPIKEKVADSSQYIDKPQKNHEEALSNPLYRDVHQIAGDLHFIKNVVLFGLICFIISIVCMIIVGIINMM